MEQTASETTKQFWYVLIAQMQPSDVTLVPCRCASKQVTHKSPKQAESRLVAMASATHGCLPVSVAALLISHAAVAQECACTRTRT